MLKNSKWQPCFHLKSRAFSTRAFSHIGRFRLTPDGLTQDIKSGLSKLSHCRKILRQQPQKMRHKNICAKVATR